MMCILLLGNIYIFGEQRRPSKSRTEYDGEMARFNAFDWLDECRST